ncbi:MAG: hypothetical protein FD143_3270 [Ignavibacteria bacterium]|nr:MAG: hypothetical protein FD143_3270 [Ignavibacteria bacterium]
MAKETKIEIKPEIKPESTEPKTKKVVFVKPFSGSLNYFYVEVTNRQIQTGQAERELPLHVYKWIQKFKVCKDA